MIWFWFTYDLIWFTYVYLCVCVCVCVRACVCVCTSVCKCVLELMYCVAHCIHTYRHAYDRQDEYRAWYQNVAPMENVMRKSQQVIISVLCADIDKFVLVWFWLQKEAESLLAVHTVMKKMMTMMSIMLGQLSAIFSTKSDEEGMMWYMIWYYCNPQHLTSLSTNLNLLNSWSNCL